MVLATSFIAALHVVHGMVTSALDLPCYHLAFHCALATMWALAAGFTLFAAKVCMSGDRPGLFGLLIRGAVAGVPASMPLACPCIMPEPLPCTLHTLPCHGRCMCL